jgi:hypothetical protein
MPRREREEFELEVDEGKVKLFFYYFPLTSRLFCSSFSVTSLVHGLIEFLQLELVEPQFKKKSCRQATHNVIVGSLPSSDLLPLSFVDYIPTFYSLLTLKFLLVPPF